MTVTRSDDVRLAERVVRVAADAAGAYFGRTEGLGVEYKGSASDPVSAADRAAEAAVKALLTRERPADGMVGEEGTDEAGTSGRRWVLDPLDGTINFVAGSPLWCSQVALVEHASTLAAAVYDAACDELFSAGCGTGGWCNGAPLRVAAADRLADAAVGTYIDRNRMALDGVPEVYLRLAAAAGTLRQPGSGGLTMAWVAAGRLAAIAMAAVPDWDWLPGELLIVEAGGRSVSHGAWRVAGSPGVVDEIAGLI